MVELRGKPSPEECQGVLWKGMSERARKKQSTPRMIVYDFEYVGRHSSLALLSWFSSEQTCVCHFTCLRFVLHSFEMPHCTRPSCSSKTDAWRHFPEIGKSEEGESMSQGYITSILQRENKQTNKHKPADY